MSENVEKKTKEPERVFTDQQGYISYSWQNGQCVPDTGWMPMGYNATENEEEKFTIIMVENYDTIS